MKYITIFLILLMLSCSKEDLSIGQETDLVATKLIMPTKKKDIKPGLVTISAAFSKRYDHTSVEFNGKLWVIGGYGNSGATNDVWNSENGAHWINMTPPDAPRRFSSRYGHASVVFQDKMWVIGGNTNDGLKNDVWSSSDGQFWSRATEKAAFSPRSAHSVVVFNNQLWLIGGSANEGIKSDIWRSNDGITWVQASQAAGFSNRYRHASVVLNNQIWVIGGIGAGFQNDVWSSQDGFTWKQVNNSAISSTRANNTVVVYNNNLWLIGGYGSDSAFKNDVWFSENGADWFEKNPPIGFSPRSSHTATIFNNEILVIAGILESGITNEVWALQQ